MPSINLLPWRTELRQRRQKEFAVGMFAAVALALVIAFLWHIAVNSMIDAQNRRNELLQTEIAQLDKQIEEILNLEEQKRRMLARMEVIERLQRSRPEVVHLFDQLVRTLPDGVYLTSVKQNDRKLELSGVAQSSTRVSAFMRNIDASDTLSLPELKVIQTRSDTAPGADFTLYATLRAPEGQEEAAAPNDGKARRVSEKR
jgi:type IV pilus assembly protein PilN